jgi:hypothetical protein
VVYTGFEFYSILVATNSVRILPMPSPLVKPYKDFPLTADKQGYWEKVTNGKQLRFGTRWCDPDEALRTFLNRKDDVKANREPEPEIIALKTN